MNFSIETVSDDRALSVTWVGIGVTAIIGVGVGILLCD